MIGPVFRAMRGAFDLVDLGGRRLVTPGLDRWSLALRRIVTTSLCLAGIKYWTILAGENNQVVYLLVLLVNVVKIAAIAWH